MIHCTGADYLAAVMANAYRSNTSYLKILQPDQVTVIKRIDYWQLKFQIVILVVNQQMTLQQYCLAALNFSVFTLVKTIWEKSAIKIARGLHNTSSLTEVSIAINNFGSEAADDIAAVLSHNTKLQHLYIHENNLGKEGAIKIARGLQILHL